MDYFMQHKKHGGKQQITETQYNELKQKVAYTNSWDFYQQESEPNLKGMPIADLEKMVDDQPQPTKKKKEPK